MINLLLRLLEACWTVNKEATPETNDETIYAVTLSEDQYKTILSLVFKAGYTKASERAINGDFTPDTFTDIMQRDLASLMDETELILAYRKRKEGV